MNDAAPVRECRPPKDPWWTYAMPAALAVGALMLAIAPAAAHVADQRPEGADGSPPSLLCRLN